jgi:predicted RNase H-like nuclease
VNTLLIGVDCAVQPTDTGLVRAVPEGELLDVLEARCGSTRDLPAKVIAGWIRESERVLIALDAPLGWPSPLGLGLIEHEAGGPLRSTANQMFRRLTDDVLCERLGKRSLDVGADKIARTAHSALRLLEDLRQSLGIEIPLAWSSNWPGRVAAIEVYPAATRLGLGLPKLPKGADPLEGLQSRMRIAPEASLGSSHVRDAVLCALSGLEFLRDRARAPTQEQRPRALKEGWIWVP